MVYNYKKGLVSLVTPGWNGETFVHRLLDSILQQTYRPLQYIYVDDCSTDGTINVVKSYEQKFFEVGVDFRLLRREQNGGLSEAVMTGLQYVEGEFFSCPEYDDVLMPTSIEKRVMYLQKHQDCAVVTADAWVVTDSDLSKRSHLISNKNINRFDLNHFYQSCLSRSIYNAACFMIRTSMFDETHSDRRFFSSRMAANQQILLPLYYHWNRGFIEEPLSLMVIRSNSVSHGNNATLQQKLDRLDEYHKILFSTLDCIEMLDEDRDLYKHRIDVNFQKDYIELGFIYDDKALFDSAYAFLKKEGELPSDSLWQKRIMAGNLLKLLYKMKKKVQAFF